MRRSPARSRSGPRRSRRAIDGPSTRGIRRFIPPLLHDAPDFRRLWVGQTISVFGDQVTQLGLPLVAVLILGADATQMGTLMAVGLLPHVLFSLPAGVWLDRVRARRRLMIAADLGRAALIASIPIASAMGVLSMPQLSDQPMHSAASSFRPRSCSSRWPGPGCRCS